MKITFLRSYGGKHALTRPAISAPLLPEVAPLWCGIEKGLVLHNPKVSPGAFPSTTSRISFMHCPCAEPGLFLFEHQWSQDEAERWGRTGRSIWIGGKRTSGRGQGWSIGQFMTCVFTSGMRGLLGHVIVARIGAAGMRNGRRSVTLWVMHTCSDWASSNSRHEMSTGWVTPRKRGNAEGVWGGS